MALIPHTHTAGCKWRVPRSKLLPSFVKELVLRCPNAVHVDYLRDADTTDVVWLDDVQLQCKPAPWEWTVVAKEQRVLVDAACDPHYQGQYESCLITTSPVVHAHYCTCARHQTHC
jgi:hypothetical protein